MTTTLNGLGVSPPNHFASPATICIHSSNGDVKLWVYHCLLTLDPDLTDAEVWALARIVRGDGEDVLSYDMEDWEKQVPTWGIEFNYRIQKSR